MVKKKDTDLAATRGAEVAEPQAVDRVARELIEVDSAQPASLDTYSRGLDGGPEVVDDPDDAPTSQPSGEQLGLRAGAVELIPIDKIDIEDTTYMFRAALRIGPLMESLRNEGQQVPIVVRGRRGRQKVQLVSGFRRVTAAAELGWTSIAAVKRNGMDDREAFHASVLENAHRKTYSDIDRAIAIRAYEKQGYKGTEIADLMGLSKRQKNNLLSLLEMPEDVQEAIDDEAQHFSATHALMVKRMKGKHDDLDYAEWIAKVNDEQLSVAALTRALNKRFKKPAADTFTGIFRDDDTDADEGVFRLAPVKLEVDKMSEGDKARLRAELEQLLAKL